MPNMYVITIFALVILPIFFEKNLSIKYENAAAIMVVYSISSNDSLSAANKWMTGTDEASIFSFL